MSDTESEGAAPCSAAESPRRGGADAEAGPATDRSKVRRNIMQRRQTRLVSTLDELMRRRSSSTGNLLGGDTMAGRGAAVAVAGVNLIGGDTLATLAGCRAAIAASSVKRHS